MKLVTVPVMLRCFFQVQSIMMLGALFFQNGFSQDFGSPLCSSSGLFYIPVDGAEPLFAELSFEEALVVCQQDNHTLARISNLVEFEEVEGLVNKTGLESFWIGEVCILLLSLIAHMIIPGLNDKVSTPGDIEALDTSRFSFVDGSTEGLEFFEKPGELPWRVDQPNNDPNDQLCVA